MRSIRHGRVQNASRRIDQIQYTRLTYVQEAVLPHEDTEEEPTPRKHTYYAYSQVPEGDPALFQQQELFPPVPHPKEPPPMTRRVRGPKRRKRCSFCRGDDQKNKYGVPESMVGCSECGRVGAYTAYPFLPQAHQPSRSSILLATRRCRRDLALVCLGLH